MYIFPDMFFLTCMQDNFYIIKLKFVQMINCIKKIEFRLQKSTKNYLNVLVLLVNVEYNISYKIFFYFPTLF